MAFVSAELLIEYAIRIGTDDLMDDPYLIDQLFFADPLTQQGRNLTPDGQSEQVYEQLIMDYFQKRLNEIPRRGSEQGEDSIFKNTIPAIPDIKDYLSSANMNIVHGYPRETSDLPAISITPGNEDEQQYIGVTKTVADDTNDNQVYDLIGSDMATSYNIEILTPNYDETIIWYRIIKYCLLRYRHAIEAYGMRNQSMSWFEAEPASEYLQAGLFIYRKTCMLRCEREEFIPVKKDGYTELAFSTINENQIINEAEILPGVNPEEIIP